jgi:nicotinamide-nucleotide amidase
MQHIITYKLIDILKNEFITPNIIHRSLVTSGEGESFVAERLKDFEQSLPNNIKLAYLPKLNMVKLRLTGIDVTSEKIEIYFNQLKSYLSTILVGEGDIELEHMLSIILKEKKKTISVAESCTGGNIAARITSIQGSSVYFKGGLVPYSIESKINVLNVDALSLFKSDYALSISGYLEKNDHNNIVWIALASSTKSYATSIIAPYDREKNTVLATNTALNLLRLFILEN